jgi:GMP synthase-like glutamine amidotransferase
MKAAVAAPMRLTIIQHHPAEHCGEVAAWARARGVALDVYRADLGQLPNGEANAEPSLLLGGPYPLDAVPNPLGWLRQEQAWLAQRVIDGTPVFGICLGAQLLCMARGGTVTFMAEAETGWTKIKIENSADVTALQWHEDECILPEDACIMGRSRQCAAQYFMFEDGRHIGLQFHPEWNAALVEELNAYFKAESPLPKGGEIADAATQFAAIRIWFWALLDSWWATAHSSNLVTKAKS